MAVNGLATGGAVASPGVADAAEGSTALLHNVAASSVAPRSAAADTDAVRSVVHSGVRCAARIAVRSAAANTDADRSSAVDADVARGAVASAAATRDTQTRATSASNVDSQGIPSSAAAAYEALVGTANRCPVSQTAVALAGVVLPGA